MPTFLTPKITFIHVPKTGGTWVTQAVIAAGVPVRPPDPLGDQHYSPHGHAGPDDLDLAGSFSVAFTRHPLDWWRSYWGHRMRAGWDPHSELDMATAREDFNDFALAVVERFPGHFSDVLDRFVGIDERHVDYVGRFECLVEHTCAALRRGGESFCESAIRAHRPENINDYERFPAAYRPEVAMALARAEQRAIASFYSDDAVPRCLLAPRAGRARRFVTRRRGHDRLRAVGA